LPSKKNTCIVTDDKKVVCPTWDIRKKTLKFDFPADNWKEKASEAIAQMVVAEQKYHSGGHFERRDTDDLAEKIYKTLDEYEKEWG
jgi:hypothetical protein